MTNDAPERNDLRIANLMRDVVNEVLARYDVPFDVYEQDVLTADKIADDAQAELQAAVAAEREACAEEVEERAAIARSKPDWCVTAPVCEAEALRCASRIRDRANPDPLAALAARDARVRAEALRDAEEAWGKLRHVAVNNTNDPDEWEALIVGMDAALIPADQEGDG